MQHRDETLRQLMQRFSHLRNTVPRIESAWVISVFCHGVRDKDMLGELDVHQPEMVTQLFQLADTCALQQETQAWHDPPAKQGTDSGTEPTKSQKKKLLKKRRVEEILATRSPAAKTAQPGKSPARKPKAFKPPTGKFCVFHNNHLAWPDEVPVHLGQQAAPDETSQRSG